MKDLIELIKYFGKKFYYISGNSGDFSMHGKKMIRATKQINNKIIQMFFPDILKNKNFKSFLKGEILFSDLDLDYNTYNKLTNKTDLLYNKYLKTTARKKFNL